ncbi:MAG: hypothetical protein JWQ55_312, partial [Rhodopila sp.]|nr:hypothetical protein [Rhodopila sp.]
MAVPTNAETSAIFAGVKNVTIDQTAALQHVMRPPHTAGVISSKGLEEGRMPSPPRLSTAASYHLDVAGFGQAVHAAIKDIVAGYCLEMRQNGTTIYT